MDSSLAWVVNTTNSDCDLLYGFLIALLLNLDLANGDLIYSQAVDSLASSFNYGTFLHEEFVGVVPEVTLMHLNVHSNALFLEP